MPSPEINTNYFGSDGVDLGKKLISKDYLLSVYPQIGNQITTPELWIWGTYTFGQLGDNTATTNRSTPITTFAGGANWKQVYSGYSISAIKTDGTFWVWGRNQFGQLGNNTVTNRNTPVTTFAGGSNWKQVSGGYAHTAAIKTDGTLWTWGNNSNGQLGDNTTTQRNTPVTTFAGGTNWKQVGCGIGARSTAAIKTDGTLWTWGSNSFGSLGDNTVINRSTPVTTFAGGSNWKQVSGGYVSLAIKTDGTLWTWGWNIYGQLGINVAYIGQSNIPISPVPDTNWKQIDESDPIEVPLPTLACGNAYTSAIKTDGTLWTWGVNINGQLGDNTITQRSTPITTFTGGTNWKQVACGNLYTVAIKTDGTLWTWGSNSNGQLGDNTTTTRVTPVTTFAGGTNWKQVACGLQHTAAIKTDGTLWVWGFNSSGQLGDNTTTLRTTPITTFAGGTDWKQVACSSHTAAIKTDGTLWTWGFNLGAQLGDNTTTLRITPITTFAGGTDWKQVFCSNHTSAIKTDGTLWIWGGNSYGQLGDNTTTTRNTPVTTFAGGNDWKQVSGGQQHTSAIKTDGTLWIWGGNGTGQLGDNTITRRSTPITTFTGGTNWKQVSGGNNHTAAIKTDGTLWTWGRNNSGQLGLFAQDKRITPVTTFAGGSNWKQVGYCYFTNTAAIKTDGTLWTWGQNSEGQLGDNTTTQRSTPVTTFAGGTNWKQVACGNNHTTAIKTDGTLWTWGSNLSGKLGDNTIINRSTPITTFAGGTNWKQVACSDFNTAAIRSIDSI